jgi:hypothetical protein
VPLGGIVGNSVSGIGTAVAAPITQPLIGPSLINSLSPPRIR